jgi:hypothetical protein
MDDKEKIKLCDFWIDSPEYFGENPTGETAIDNLIDVIAGEGGKLTLKKVEEYKRKLEKHLLDKEAVSLQKKGVSYKREIIIIIITAIVSSIISNIDRILRWIFSLS